MIEAITSNFLSIDMYGRSLNFEEQNTSKLKTLFGATTTVLTILLTVFLSTFDAKKFFQQKKIVEKIDELVINSYVDLINFPLIMSMSKESERLGLDGLINNREESFQLIDKLLHVLLDVRQDLGLLNRDKFTLANLMDFDLGAALGEGGKSG